MQNVPGNAALEQILMLNVTSWSLIKDSVTCQRKVQAQLDVSTGR